MTTTCIPPRPGRRLLAALLAVTGSGLVACSAPDDPPPGSAAAPVSATASPATSAAASASIPARDYVGASALIGRPRTAGSWPGTNGLSGVNGDPLNERRFVEEFCTARGRACPIAQTYTDRTSYASMTGGTGWTFENFEGFPGALVISQGLVPEGRSADLAPCAQGAFDRHWRDFGTLMVTHGRGDSVVRLGWEFNGTFMAWAARDAKTWIGCYRRAAAGIRATNPDVLFEWTINAHSTPKGVCGGVSTNCYPGDDYVDIVGIDNYDHFPAAATKAAFDRVAAAPEGLDWLLAFARRHGKVFAVGEWGVVSNRNGGGDSPDFIRWMHQWFARHAPELAYEAYFTSCGNSIVQSSLYRTGADCTPNPRAGRVYRSLFSA